ncbi:hypothetical protein AB6A40_011296 [Gnathostoma spinigerum]|uniref:THAP-type domain-containing protein n=1 Tax=Gnathostoma spinigerum TaxID=75299 RepID=A0ABD6F3V8_9BILA
MRRTRGEGCMVQNCVMETVTAKYSTVNGTLYSLPENKIRAMYWICACIPDIELRRKYICTVMSTKQACFLKVCERHFVERRPTENNPYPTLHLPDHVKALETPLTFCAIKGIHWRHIHQ